MFFMERAVTFPHEVASVPGQIHQGSPDVFWAEIAPSAHIAQFYTGDAVLLDTLVGFVGGGLKAGESTIVIATSEHLNLLEQGLTQSGADVPAARSAGRYIAWLADAALSAFMVNDWPDDRLFTEFVESLIAHARAKGPRVRAFGEMVAVLWAKGHSGAMVRLEHLWNQIANKQEFSMLCAYPTPGFTEDFPESLAKICALHSRIVWSPNNAANAHPDKRHIR